MHWFLVYSKVIQIYKYICIFFSKYIFLYIYYFFIFFSIIVYCRVWDIVSCAIHRTLLFTPSIHDGLHLLTSNSHFIPSPPPSPLATMSLLSMSVSLFLFHR